MVKHLHFIWALTAFLFVLGCDTNKPLDREAIKEELRNREIRQVSKAELLDKGFELGNAIVADLQPKFQQALSDGFAKGSVAEAVQYCNLEAIGITAEYEKQGILAYRVSSRNRNKQNAPDSIETLILEAYEYSSEKKEEMRPSIVEENDAYVLFTKPILISNTLCLNCHGQVGKDLTNETYTVIQGLYPEDKAVGFAMGDLRGMWSIRIPKKLIVEQL